LYGTQIAVINPHSATLASYTKTMKTRTLNHGFAEKIFFHSVFVCTITVLLLLFANTGFAQPTTATYWLQGRNGDDAPLTTYQARRERVLAALSGKSFLVMFAAHERNRQNDVQYEYRQNSDMFYCSGFCESESALILAPAGIVLPDSLDSSHTRHTALLFVKEAAPRKELWTGAITGSKRAQMLYGIKTLGNQQLRGVLDKMLVKHDTAFITGLPTPRVIEPLVGDTLDLEETFPERYAKKNPNLIVRSHKRLLGELRKIKDPFEIELLRKAVNITVAGHREAIESVRLNQFEYETEAVMEAAFKRRGAEDVGYASIVGAGANSCVLHYTTSRRQMRSGELLLMDCGAEYHNYTADITRTVPVNGKFTPEQREIYNLVYAAQKAALKEYRKNTDWRKPHSRAVETVRAGLLKLGIITSPDDYKLYFPHGSVHYIGLDVHDAGAYSLFQPNMVLTCEPGIYIPENSPCDKKWWNIGVRIEDDVLITDGEPEVLSDALPRTAEEIERMMKARKK
jgi:Xaa-Pro aminopeptidase